jgi:hypothetical protein
MPNLQARYGTIMATADPFQRRVARRQLARLARVHAPSVPRVGASRSRWAHVPLEELFAAAGNLVHTRAGRVETGHEPLHRSKSGRCVLLDATVGRWWCRGCHQHGDAAGFVMAWRAWTYRQAARWLTDRYGAPLSHSDPLRPAVEA